MSARRRLGYAVALFLLAPYIGEYVLGNMAITSLPQLFLLAPMYGGGALIIREVGRRTRAGWPVMIVLGVAYALVEEGLVDQMIFNPGYLGLDSFAGLAPIPGLGISATLTLDSVALHAIGSTCVPIAIVEAFDREEPKPWLGRTGLGVVFAVFVVGSTALALLQADQFHFVGSVRQFAVTAGAVVVLVAVAARQASRRPAAPIRLTARSPRTIGVVAFTLATVFWLIDMIVPSVTSTWVAVGGGTLVLTAGILLLGRESQRLGWGRSHRLAVASGALSTYLWLAFVNTALLGISPLLGVVGNIIFGSSAVAIMVVARRAELHSALVSLTPGAA